VTCVWGASLEQAFCGMAVCVAIAKLTGGAVYSDFTEGVMPVETCAAQAHALLADVRRLNPPSLRKEWPVKLLSLLNEQHLGNRLNPSVRWPSTEVVREVDGVFYSHTSYFNSGHVHHDFAVTACLAPTGLAPFHAGSRLGVGGLNGDMPTSHQLRKGYEDVIRGFATKAEAQRGPRYSAALKSAAPTLLQCLHFVMSKPEILRNEERVRHYEKKLAPYYPSVEVIARPPPEWRKVKSQELPEAIVYAAHEGFAECRDEWSTITIRLAGLL
jgi:hypothetical protein